MKKHYLLLLSLCSIIFSCNETRNTKQPRVEVSVDTTDNIEHKLEYYAYIDSSVSIHTQINILNQEEYSRDVTLTMYKDGKLYGSKYEERSWSRDSASITRTGEPAYEYSGTYIRGEDWGRNSVNNKRMILNVNLFAPKVITYNESKGIMSHVMTDLQRAFRNPADTIYISDSTSFGIVSGMLLKTKQVNTEEYSEIIRIRDCKPEYYQLTQAGDTMSFYINSSFMFSEPETIFDLSTYH